MDPFTMMALMGAAGGMMQMGNQQGTPSNALGGSTPINLQNYQPYFNSVLAGGNNPMAQQYVNSSQMANSSMKNNLANRGVLNSSAGDAAMSGLNTNLANSYIANQLSRQQQALQTVGSFQNGAMASNLGLGQANNQQGWNTFGGNAMNGNNMVGGFGAMTKGIGGAYKAYMGNQNSNNDNNQSMTDFQNYMNFQNQSNQVNTGTNSALGTYSF